MAKFQALEEAFWHIRDNPREYLPEKSLAFFEAFWWGYQWRFEIEHPDHRGFDLLDGFDVFMTRKFRVPSGRGPSSIATLYTDNQSDAFDFWFENLQTFIREGSAELKKYYSERSGLVPVRKEIDFFALIKAITKRPAMYVGANSFTLITLFLDGWVCATRDFGLVESDQEKIYRDFQTYIESKPHWLRAEIENPDLPPPPSWKKLILEWTNHTDLEEKALVKFAGYFDEFAFQGKGYVDYVEFHWKHHQEHIPTCRYLV